MTENKDKKKITQDGYVAGDIKIEAAVSKKGNPFSVANFSIVFNNEGEKQEYRPVSAYGENIDKVMALKKGDLIRLKGTEQEYTKKSGEKAISISLLECEILKAVKRQKMVSLKGNLKNDIELIDITTNESEKVKVANFSIVYKNENGEKAYQAVSAYGKNASKVADLKKGDFIHVQGTEKHYKNKEGKDRTSIHLYSYKMLKAKEDREKDKEASRADKKSKNNEREI
nr:hypothetical protein [uncultured Peptoniphilus sp.]